MFTPEEEEAEARVYSNSTGAIQPRPKAEHSFTVNQLLVSPLNGYRYRILEVDGNMLRVILDPHREGFNRTPEWTHFANYLPE